MPTENKPHRVVLDTNIFISALVFGGTPGRIKDAMFEGEIQVIVSHAILNELADVLAEDFHWNPDDIENAILLIRNRAELVFPDVRISVVQGKDSDNRILECAVEGHAQFLITGDKRHLLPLKTYEGIEILSPREFLERFPEDDSQ